MTAIDLLIFDLDGTLVDTRQDLTNSVNFVRSQFDLPPLELPDVMTFVGDGLHKLMQRALASQDLDRIEKAATLFGEHYRDHCLDFSALYDDAREILHHFHNKKMAVISNKPDEFTLAILKGLEVDSHFKVILGGDSQPQLKPSPAAILLILEKLEVQPERAVIIGDGTTDIEAGRRAGIHTCAVTYGYRSREILAASQPEILIENLGELKSHFG
jgi:phosphoglycolate phosphatase